MMPLESGDDDLLRRLHGLGAATIRQLCDELGVTATAVRHRLDRLLAQNFVDRRAEAIGRGRPQHYYSITEAGRAHLGDNYAELALLLWEQMVAITDPVARKQVLTGLKDALVRRYGEGVAGENLPDRFKALQVVLSRRGFPVSVMERNNLPVLREEYCPYHELAHLDGSVCELEQQVFSEVLGVPLRLTSCCRTGATACEFEMQLSEPPQKGLN